MDVFTILYWMYIVLGFVLAIFNRFFGIWIYRLALVFTDRLHLSEMFLFKIDKKNRDSFYFLIRTFCVVFGLTLSLSALYVFFM